MGLNGSLITTWIGSRIIDLTNAVERKSGTVSFLLLFLVASQIAGAQQPVEPSPPTPAVSPAPAVPTTLTGPSPTPTPKPIAPVPIFVKAMGGTADYEFDSQLRLDQGIGNGRALSLLVEVGRQHLTFQTGFFNIQTTTTAPNQVSSEIEFWGIPVELKFNFTGRPNSTMYLKAGIIPIDDGEGFSNEIDLLARGGIGFGLPLGTERAAIVIEGNYDWLLTREIFESSMTGLVLQAGVSAQL